MFRKFVNFFIMLFVSFTTFIIPCLSLFVLSISDKVGWANAPGFMLIIVIPIAAFVSLTVLILASVAFGLSLKNSAKFKNAIIVIMSVNYGIVALVIVSGFMLLLGNSYAWKTWLPYGQILLIGSTFIATAITGINTYTSKMYEPKKIKEEVKEETK